MVDACFLEGLCRRKRLMLFSLKFQRNNRQNALAEDSAKGKTGEKGCNFHRAVEMKQPYTITEPKEYPIKCPNHGAHQRGKPDKKYLFSVHYKNKATICRDRTSWNSKGITNTMPAIGPANGTIGEKGRIFIILRR